MIAVVDGVVLPADEATISAFDRSAWYGDAAFETFRTHGRRVHALELRLDRLERSLATLGITTLRSALVRDLGRAIAAFADDDAYVRIAVSRGVGRGGLVPSGAEVPTTTVVVATLPVFPTTQVTTGLTLVTQASCLSAHGGRGAGAKLASYVEPMLAFREARQRGADDAIGLDRDGVVLEATTSNLFVHVDGQWQTPPTELGILPGITRACAMALVPVRTRLLTVHDLYRADEIALTSSVRGLVPGVILDGRPVGTGIPGPRFRELREKYTAMVASEAYLVDASPDSR